MTRCHLPGDFCSAEMSWESAETLLSEDLNPWGGFCDVKLFLHISCAFCDGCTAACCSTGSSAAQLWCAAAGALSLKTHSSLLGLCTFGLRDWGKCDGGSVEMFLVRAAQGCGLRVL